jgi:DeoR family transcriptional regulator, fructose operon transcriptional repressor
MLPIERLERIKEYIATNEFADINDLAQMLEVSTATVRRSLKQLENDRVVNLTRGGATLAKKGAVYEHPYMVKRHLNADEKRRIAQEASRRVGKNQSFFLDSSSTVFEMTSFVSGGSPMVVATNDVLIAAELTNSENLSVSVIGGTLRKGYYTLTGYFAEMAFRDVSFDYAFLGIDTISLRGGLMITNSEEVQIKRKVADSSNRVVVLCDHSKFEQESFLHVCGFDRVDEVITGRELDDEVYRRYLDNGVNLTRV